MFCIVFRGMTLKERAGPWRTFRSETLKLRAHTAQEQKNTSVKFRLFYFSILFSYSNSPNSHSNSQKINDSPPDPHCLCRLSAIDGSMSSCRISHVGWIPLYRTAKERPPLTDD